jgi:hypothetical protein
MFAWGSPACDNFYHVCIRCGMEYPNRKTPPSYQMKELPEKTPSKYLLASYDLSEVFENCPNCGASTKAPDSTWANLVDSTSYPWMDLDGCVGRPRR